MKNTLVNGCLLAVLLGGCITAPPEKSLAVEVPARPAHASFTIEPAAERGLWVLRTVRQLDGFKAEGVISVSSDITPPPDTPHAALAGSRAFLMLGQERLRAGDFPRAIAAAQAGLKELGQDYAPRTTLDDTSLTVRVAQDSVEQGYPERGARQILRALGARHRLYVRKHAPFVHLPAEENAND